MNSSAIPVPGAPAMPRPGKLLSASPALIYGLILAAETLWAPQGLRLSSLLIAMAFTLITAWLFLLALRAVRAFLATWVALVGMAFAFRLASVADHPVALGIMSASAGSVLGGLMVVTCFMGTVVFGAMVVGSGLRRPGPRRHRDQRSPESPWKNLGMWAALAVSGVAAALTGGWTAYGAEVNGSIRGGVQFELFYSPILWAVVPLVGHDVVSRLLRGRRVGLFVSIAFALVVLLAFALQGRRLFIYSLVFVTAMAFSREWSDLATNFKPPWRALGGATLLAAALFMASNAWRSSAARSPGLNLVDRLSEMRLDDVVSIEATEGLRERFTYMGLDAISVEYAPVLRGAMSLWEMAASSAINAVPTLLLPEKYALGDLSMPQVCETAFARVGNEDDLPCTPESEAYIAAGMIGVLLVAFVWALAFATLDIMLASPSATIRFAALLAAAPLMGIETSAFPIFLSIRSALVVGAPILLVNWSAKIPRRAVRALSPVVGR